MALRIQVNHIYLDTNALQRAEGEEIHISIFSEKGELILDSDITLVSSSELDLFTKQH